MTGSIQHKEMTMENTLHWGRRDPNFWCCIKSIQKIKIPQTELDALWSCRWIRSPRQSSEPKARKWVPWEKSSACFLTHLNLSFPDTEKDEKPACIEQSSSAFVKHIHKKFFKSYAKTWPRKTNKKYRSKSFLASLLLDAKQKRSNMLRRLETNGTPYLGVDVF
jgi:hypothetical protein